MRSHTIDRFTFGSKFDGADALKPIGRSAKAVAIVINQGARS